MDIVLQESPFQTLLLVPLVHLTEILAHKEQFLTRMPHHEPIGGTEVCELFLLGVPRHFSGHGTFSVDHLIV